MLERCNAPRPPGPLGLGVPTLFAAPDAEVTPDLVGDILLATVAWARAHGIDAESALRMANARYAAEVAAQI